MKKNIPNTLTLFRGVAALAIVLLFFSPFPERFFVIYVLFLLAALSDYLDGFLARQWNVTSKFGIICDPLFDKVLVLTLIVLLYPFNIVSPFILLILLIRDITTDVLKNYLLSRGVTTPAIYSAKIKTASQMLMLNFMIFSLAAPSLPYTKIAATIFGILAVIFSLWSGGIYVRRFIDFAREDQRSSSQ